MKFLQSLIRKVVLSSVAASSSSLALGGDLNLEDDLNNNQNFNGLAFNNENENQPKLLLKFKGNDSWSINSHRSHRSHSSHRSHYSSSSSGSSSSGSSTSSSSSSSSSLGIRSATPTNSVLGSRSLKLGDVGADVTQLINLLLKKKYLVMEDGSISVSGILTFDKIIEDAVKQFQTDNNQKPDGIVGPSTLYLLKSEK
ncbi:hypothetical protein J2X69_000345 [Algoriphagus sp. 4150]|uniref:peptidoglycan-binding domain-containing protein n=1 Tax=Algoriphagus sp. 4150 TaxID=2817756 RepID=UPI00285D5CF6|nr:peptidoglycan-binding domain-containing protein [Algoriphagus sp. 4150]MDR7128017.1 hypothetical protein [Algoriphagus sp. 4150]